ncbi:cyclic nucleotide-binding domain-containing protein, partial [Enterocloster asparagiformis]
MEEFLHILRKSPLFYGVNDDELYTLLKCCAAEQTRYEEGEYIYRMGESLNSIMIMLSGSAMVVQENFWGRQEELFRVKEGEIFGESYSCARTAVLPVSVVTEGPCEVLFLQYQR